MIPLIPSSKTQTKRYVQDSRRGRGKLSGRNDKRQDPGRSHPLGQGQRQNGALSYTGRRGRLHRMQPIAVFIPYVCVSINV